MKQVLLIEDDTKLHTLYKEALLSQDIAMTAVTTGKEGLEKMKENPPDLVILDIMLPGGLNGFDVAEQIRQNPATRTLPILILTNLDSEQQSAQSVGAEYFVKTNTSLEEITRKVKEMLHTTLEA